MMISQVIGNSCHICFMSCCLLIIQNVLCLSAAVYKVNQPFLD
uniref:Uncharacterized protein n=1 Tax=Ciona intestinalis TaxID=7719 RepID=H2XTP8_CIOIN